MPQFVDLTGEQAEPTVEFTMAEGMPPYAIPFTILKTSIAGVVDAAQQAEILTARVDSFGPSIAVLKSATIAGRNISPAELTGTKAAILATVVS